MSLTTLLLFLRVNCCPKSTGGTAECVDNLKMPYMLVSQYVEPYFKKCITELKSKTNSYKACTLASRYVILTVKRLLIAANYAYDSLEAMSTLTPSSTAILELCEGTEDDLSADSKGCLKNINGFIKAALNTKK